LASNPLVYRFLDVISAKSVDRYLKLLILSIFCPLLLFDRIFKRRPTFGFEQLPLFFSTFYELWRPLPVPLIDFRLLTLFFFTAQLSRQFLVCSLVFSLSLSLSLILNRRLLSAEK
jgi:hypothetical protein